MTATRRGKRLSLSSILHVGKGSVRANTRMLESLGLFERIGGLDRRG